MNTESCDMIRHTDVESCLGGPPGSFFFDISETGQKRLWFVLPNGESGVINIRPVVAGQEAHPSWGFDGNEDKPSLLPSVHCVGRWHGWFRTGRMESC